FYVQQGLLPAAGSPGPGARYGAGHVARLRLIRMPKRQHLPLAEIGKRLKGLSDDHVEGLVAEARQRRAPGGTALDYIRGVLSDSRPLTALPSPPRGWALAQPVVGSITFEPAADPPPSPRSQWDRLTLADGIELHVQRPLSRELRRRLDRLMAAAREIFD